MLFVQFLFKCLQEGHEKKDKKEKKEEVQQIFPEHERVGISSEVRKFYCFLCSFVFIIDLLMIFNFLIFFFFFFFVLFII